MIVETFGFELLCSQCLNFLFANFFRFWIKIFSFSTGRFRSCYSPIQLDCQFVIRLNIFNKRLKFTFKQIIYSELKFLRFLSISRRAPTQNQGIKFFLDSYLNCANKLQTQSGEKVTLNDISIRYHKPGAGCHAEWSASSL